MTTNNTTSPAGFSTLEELARKTSVKFPEGYDPAVHDSLDAADAAADIADARGFDDDNADLAVHMFTHMILRARAARGI